MNTDKKNQHYIPKFYLRNFSVQNNKKQIGIFNIQSDFFFGRSKLKTQGSKNFFYGYDGKIEDELSVIEGTLAQVIKEIIDTKTIPKKNGASHLALLTFVGLTHLRNPVAIEQLKGNLEDMKKTLLSLDPKVDTTKFVPEITHEDAIKMVLSNLSHVVENMLDLDYKLLINKTETPFISSDFPIVKYNQFLESLKWEHGKTGYGNTGLQIFIPLNSELSIVFYDSMIYKVGFKKQQHHEIHNIDDVDSLNVLQIINCFETIYFNELASEHYIRKLINQSKRFKRANDRKTELSYIVKDGENHDKILKSGKPNLVIMGSSDCETKLKIGGLKMHSKSKGVRLHPSMAQLRPHAARIRE